MPFAAQHLLPVLALLLSILSSKLRHAHGWSSAICEDGMSYNKACESDCNNAYKDCSDESSLNDGPARILSHPDKCSKKQSKCMVTCYAKADDMCTATPSSDGSNINDDDVEHHEKGLSYEVEEALVGATIAIGAALVLYLLADNDYDGGDGEVARRATDQQQELIGRESGIDEEPSAIIPYHDDHGQIGLVNHRGLSDLCVANNLAPAANESKTNSRENITSSHYAIPAIGDGANDVQRDGFLLLEDVPPKRPDLILV